MTEKRALWLVANPASGSNTPAAIEALESCCGDHGFSLERRIAFPDEPLPNAAALDSAGVDTPA